MSFVHLHVHSIYSNSDSLCRPKQLAGKAIEMGMPAVALTDHGVMSGMPDFVKACKDASVKPIIGLEFYVSTMPIVHMIGKSNPHVKQDTGHLTVLVKNEAGYQNIVRLASKGFEHVFRARPRIQIDDLKKHHEGLIVMTGCMFSWFNLWILRHHHILDTNRSNDEKMFLSKGDPYFSYHTNRYGFIDKMKNTQTVPIIRPYKGEFLGKVIKDYKDLKEVFGDDLYIEVQNHGVFGQKEIREFWDQHFPDEKKVATNDVHYINSDDWVAQDFLTRIRMGGDDFTYFMKPLDIRTSPRKRTPKRI